MNKSPPPHRLNALARARINQLAHRLGQAHEVAQRAMLLSRLSTATAAGATVAELNELIDKLEAGPAPVCKGANHAA